MAYGLMNVVSIGPVNDLLPDDTKPLLEPVVFRVGQFWLIKVIVICGLFVIYVREGNDSSV